MLNLLLSSISLASAQLLTSQTGGSALPSCAQTCTALTNAQSQCSTSGSAATVQTWECFCRAVWNAANENIATVCASSCSAQADNAAVSTWYSDNCGSDNGVKEHGGGTATTGGEAGTESSAAAASGSASSSPVASENGSGGCSGSWVDCHWQWLVFLIVVFCILLTLGLLGRWFKKRHDRKRDNAAFNSGITSRAAVSDKPDANNTSHLANAASATDSPARTRDAFMPYGYAYNNSQRGSTPVAEVEKGVSPNESAAQSSPGGKLKKLGRRVLVRERQEN